MAAAAAVAAAVGEGGGLLDRSKVRILLCDNNAKSSQEVLNLLTKCCYQVTLVRTARQVINVLNAQGSNIDIILAEVDLPVPKGLKMLKYITRDVELRRIPIIMMSSQDEVSVVVKCLRLGAADYLVKPLRTNELLNLWTHMWRRRRMLGLMEKNIFSHDFDSVVSDHSDANTNSTTFLSEDTDDKLKKAVQPETSISNCQLYVSIGSCIESERNNSALNQLSTAENGNRARIPLSQPKKTDLKIGVSSAFLTYVRSSAPISCPQDSLAGVDRAPPQEVVAEEKKTVGGDTEKESSMEFMVRHSEENFLSSGEMPTRMNTVPAPLAHTVECASSFAQPPLRNEDQINASKVSSFFPLPMYFPGSAEQNMAASTLHQVGLNNGHSHTFQAMVPQCNMVLQCPQMPIVMPTYPCYQVGVSLQGGHIPATHLWSSASSSSNPDVKPGRSERREAALIKFRQKRKERCFDKKIRYVNRQRLAERRPRIRGQFVRHVDSLDVHLGGFPATNDESEEDEEEENMSRELELESSPEHVNLEL